MHDPEKERARLRRILEQRDAELEWPCQNQVLRDLVESGEVKITRKYSSHWNGKDHSMVTLSVRGG